MPVSQRLRHALSWALVGLLAPACLCLARGESSAASFVGAGMDGSYTNRVLAAVSKIWAPPPALKNDFQTRIRISIDEDGKVAGCRVVAPSGLEAFDDAACGAARKVGPFGTPPYGQPLDVYMTFWNGTPKGAPRAQPPDSEAAMRAEIMARTRAEAVRGDQRASSAEAAARRRAEDAAKAGGKDLPEIHPAPAAPPAPPRPHKEKPRKTPSTFASQSADSSPATQRIGKSPAPAAATAKDATPGKQEKAARNARPAAPGDSAAPAPKTAPDAARASPPAGPSPVEAYRRETEARLTRAVTIPKATKAGAYTTLVRLRRPPRSKIQPYTTLSSTGDAQLDKAVRAGIRRTDRLAPPPADIKGVLTITLTLTRR